MEDFYKSAELFYSGRKENDIYNLGQWRTQFVIDKQRIWGVFRVLFTEQNSINKNEEEKKFEHLNKQLKQKLFKTQ